MSDGTQSPEEGTISPDQAATPPEGHNDKNVGISPEAWGKLAQTGRWRPERPLGGEKPLSAEELSGIARPFLDALQVNTSDRGTLSLWDLLNEVPEEEAKGIIVDKKTGVAIETSDVDETTLIGDPDKGIFIETSKPRPGDIGDD